MELLKTPQVVR